ncbi:MAG: hypothetical protein WCJ30_23725 [Deltaproteobacteria bacterium]
MRTRAAVISLGLLAIGAPALAQHRAAAHPAAATSSPPPVATAAAPAASASPAPATASPAPADSASAAPTVAAGTRPTTFDIPMVQRGQGAMVHYPLPEQLARNEVPVFVQVRSSAPIDHIALFYRGHGATRYREVRMVATGGATYGLPNGYGGLIPCEDAFPPSVEYYVQAIDTSGAAVGSAGSSTEPVALPIVRERTFNIVPTLPGGTAPRNCGTLDVVAPTNTGTTGTGPGTTTGTGTTTGGTPLHSVDLGEPCQANNECRNGLRCGSTHTCVFVRQN